MVNDPRPFFAFYPDDFWGSEAVESMTMEAAGLYLAILSRCWRRGSVTADANALRSLYGRRCSAWNESLAMVLPCFQVRDGRLYNERLEQERAIADSLSSKASASAKARWARWKAGQDAKAMRSHSDRNANAIQGEDRRGEEKTGQEKRESAGKPRPTRKKPAVDSVTLEELPEKLRDDAFVKVMVEFIAFRREKGSPVTPIALRNLLLKLEPHGTAHAAASLRDSMANGWTGVFPEKRASGAPSPLQPKPGSMREWFAQQDALAEAAAAAGRTVDVKGGVL